MKIVPGNAQHIGARAEQQDDFGFSQFHKKRFVKHGGILATLADGMGGMAMGREASRIAKAAMLKAYQAKLSRESIPQALSRALEVANEAVVALAREHGLEGETGTTMVAAAIRDRELYWVSVGDSRIYLYRRGRLTQLTADHDYGQELAEMVLTGELSQEEARTHPQRRALTSFLGLARLREVDRNLRPFPLEIGDRILLCSDGLYNALSAEEMAEILAHDPQIAADLLVKEVLAKDRARQDNVTVAILGCEPDRPGLRDRLKAVVSRKALILAVILALLSSAGWAWWTKSFPGNWIFATKAKKSQTTGESDDKSRMVPSLPAATRNDPQEPFVWEIPFYQVDGKRWVVPGGGKLLPGTAESAASMPALGTGEKVPSIPQETLPDAGTPFLAPDKQARLPGVNSKKDFQPGADPPTATVKRKQRTGKKGKAK